MNESSAPNVLTMVDALTFFGRALGSVHNDVRALIAKI